VLGTLPNLSIIIFIVIIFFILRKKFKNKNQFSKSFKTKKNGFKNGVSDFWLCFFSIKKN
jgi:hypothetical protein